MGKLLRSFLFFGIFVGVNSLAWAGWESISATDFSLPAPPAQGSLLEQQDVQSMLTLQKTHRLNECSLARSQRFPSFLAFFGSSARLLSDAELSRITPLMNRVTKLTDKITGVFKDTYKRPRPYSSYPQIKPCIPLPGGSKSYPSSHASISSAEACLLAEIFPDRADAILKYGDHLGTLRTEVGVHYPLDVQAGKNLGHQICQALLADPGFQKELKQVK